MADDLHVLAALRLARLWRRLAEHRSWAPLADVGALQDLLAQLGCAAPAGAVLMKQKAGGFAQGKAGAQAVGDGRPGALEPGLQSNQVRHIRFDGPRRRIAVPVSRLFGRSGGIKLVWERISDA